MTETSRREALYVVIVSATRRIGQSREYRAGVVSLGPYILDGMFQVVIVLERTIIPCLVHHYGRALVQS